MWVRLYMDRSTIQCTVVPDMLTPIFFKKNKVWCIVACWLDSGYIFKMLCVRTSIWPVGVTWLVTCRSRLEEGNAENHPLQLFDVGMHCSSCYRLEMEHITWKEHSCRVLGQSMITWMDNIFGNKLWCQITSCWTTFLCESMKLMISSILNRLSSQPPENSRLLHEAEKGNYNPVWEGSLHRQSRSSSRRSHDF